MAPDRDDKAEEEPFGFEEEPFDEEEHREEERYEEEHFEEDRGEEEAVPRGSRERLEAIVAGISPRTLKLILAAALALAVALVVAASIHKSRKREREKAAREQRDTSRALKFMAELKQIGDEYFRTDGQLPPDFETRFRAAGADDERKHILGVTIQSRPPGSAAFKTEVTSLSRNVSHSWEFAERKPAVIPGSDVYIHRGKVVVDLVEYDIRIYRQNITDEKSQLVGRVALMLFPEAR